MKTTLVWQFEEIGQCALRSGLECLGALEEELCTHLLRGCVSNVGVPGAERAVSAAGSSERFEDMEISDELERVRGRAGRRRGERYVGALFRVRAKYDDMTSRAVRGQTQGFYVFCSVAELDWLRKQGPGLSVGCGLELCERGFSRLRGCVGAAQPGLARNDDDTDRETLSIRIIAGTTHS